MYRFGRNNMPTGAGLVVFLAVAVVLAFVVARVLGAILSLAVQVVWYAIAFAVAVAILSWVWGQFTGRRNRSLDRTDRLDDRDEYGRRRF